MGAFFHGLWVIIFAIESAHLDAWRVCPGSGPVYDIALGGILACFFLSAINQTVMTFISLRGEAFSPKYISAACRYFYQAVEQDKGSSVLRAASKLWRAGLLLVPQTLESSPGCWPN